MSDTTDLNENEKYCVARTNKILEIFKWYQQGSVDADRTSYLIYGEVGLAMKHGLDSEDYDTIVRTRGDA